ncbi:MAG TPA: DUF5655 domain-containing protein [Acidimicrobiia bacterium]|nr:DUF5655 domain-containing protein [Acidimicrobiia bacterium]
MAWTCPECGRSFRRAGQSHECAPALELEEYFATGPSWEHPIFEAVLAHLESLGPMTVEPVSVGIFIKSNGSFVELRPKTKWVTLSFPLARRLQTTRISRKPIASGQKIFHFVNLTSPDEVDEELRGWLTESFDQFGQS